ncbi:cytochrome P450 [Gigaspora rosea]|uniref:Cytochrome P450 n=1 Tax=Gigaspora rosea TaxID=44941 RepID=A0A397UH88_9GLOM|nr:cytochrome P450 [Gigaspora rosea]
MKHIKPVIKKRLEDKKKLGDAWIAPLDALQSCLNDPEIAPDLDPNNVDYNIIVEIIEILIFTAIISLPAAVFYALYDLAGRKEYWNELYQEAQVINKQCNGNVLKSDDPDKMVKLDKFVKESLRLNIDITNVAHKCISKPYYTFENGYQVPNGRMIYVNFMSLAMDEELQGQNSKEFYAYRHDSPAIKLDHNYLVFGSGKHACPGRFLAVIVPKIFLHMVMLRYNVRTETGKMKPQKYTGPTVRPFNVGIVFENRN